MTLCVRCGYRLPDEVPFHHVHHDPECLGLELCLCQWAGPYCGTCCEAPWCDPRLRHLEVPGQSEMFT